MRKLKKALSLTLALSLCMGLALTAAGAAEMEDSPYIEFSNKPSDCVQLTLNNYYDEDNVCSPVWIFPENTTYTVVKLPEGGSVGIFGDSYYEGGWEWGMWDVLTMEDSELRGGALDELESMVSFYCALDPAEEPLEVFFFCSQPVLDDLIAKGAVSVAQIDESSDTPAEPGEPSEPSESTSPVTPVPNAVVLSPQNLEVDGENVVCEKYNIDGSNYFKLRDLAYALKGTGSRFGVGFDEASSTVSITTGEAYEPTGTEMEVGVDNSATTQPSSQTIMIDGKVHGELTVYNIGGSNFFQLRELGTLLGFEVGYDIDTNTATVRSTQN